MRTGFLPCTRLLYSVLLVTLAGGASAAEQVDLLIRNGVIYDGRGGAPVRGDVAVRDGRVVAFGALQRLHGRAASVDANGLAVAPGFINTLTLGRRIADPRRPRHERHQAGRDARDLRRRQLHGTGQ